MDFQDRSYSRDGVRAGRILGIEVWVHWILLVLLGLQLINSLLRPSTTAPRLLDWFVMAAALVLSVLLHELGHCAAAVRLGGGASRIVLWPLGGLAHCEAPHRPGTRFGVSAGGPLVNVILLALAAGVCIACGWALLPHDEWGFIKAFFQYTVLWNTFLLLLNLLPVTPLDGGRMLQAVLWARSDSAPRAAYLVSRVGHVVAAVALVVAVAIFFTGFFDRSFAARHPFLYMLQWGLLLLALMHYLETRAGGPQAEAEERDEGIFGYDFSRGYTSLERTATHQTRRVSLWAKLRESRARRARENRERTAASIEKRVDDLLARIHRDGLSSLSAAERRFLRKASKRFRG